MYSAHERSNNNINIKTDGLKHPNKHRWYPDVLKKDVTLTKNGLSLEQRKSVWEQQHKSLSSHQNTFLGFQINQSIDGEMTKPFLNMALNNDGDPFSTSSLDSMNTKVMECAVLDYFAKLWGIQESDSSSEEDRTYWGYVTSMGASEANLVALFNARDYLSGLPVENPKGTNADEDQLNLRFNSICMNGESHIPPITAHALPQDLSNGHLPDAHLKNNLRNFTPVAFFADECYHGFEKASRVLQLKTFREIGSGNFPCPLKYPDDYPTNFNPADLDQNGWPSGVPTETADGSISISCLVKLVTAFVSRGYPPIVVFTVGTTFKGASDNPQAAINKLVPILKQHNMYERRVYSSDDPTKSDVRNGFWFHIDGAMGAGQLRFLEMAVKDGLLPNMFPDGFPVFDFRIPEVKSIAVSLHKWFGCPVPSSVFIMRKMGKVKPLDQPLFIGGVDSTLSGSRGGHSVLVIWDLLSRKSYDDFKDLTVHGEQMVEFAFNKLAELQKELSMNLWLSHTPGSLFIYFRKPRQEIVRRYCLASSPLKIKSDGTFEDRIYSHICLMPHVSEKLVLQFIQELRAPGAFPAQQ